MSGIAGVYHIDGRPAGEGLDQMLDAMEHRGPDGADTWRDGPVGLGHLMLETTPEDQHESLPLVDRSGNFAITADARIDNRDELIKKLNVRKSDDRPITDTELILVAYKRWGRDCPKKLLGAFAFAVWDARKRTLTLARDHFGIRPLHYVQRADDLFALASEPTALVQAGLSKGIVNEVKVADFLLIPVSADLESTYWDDILLVPPAHVVQIGPAGKSRKDQYWKLDPDKETKLSSDAEYIEGFRELFSKAVECRMRSSTELGAMLSGGLDSTSVACTAAEKLRKTGGQLHTLSAVFDSIPEANERSYQEKTLEKYGDVMTPTVLQADEMSPLSHLSRLTRYMGRPSSGINAYIPAELYKRAGKQGVRVVLDGFDGDTTVSHGHAYHNELLWSWQWLDLWRDVRAAVNTHGGDREDQRRVLRGWIKHYLRGNPLTRPFLDLWHRFRGVREQLKEDNALKILDRGGGWSGKGWRRYIQDDFLERLKPHLEEQNKRRRWESERYHHHMMLTRPMMEEALRSFDTKASAAGVEARFPFFDVRLVEYCLSLPGSLKKRAGWSRWIERASMEGLLPAEVQWRKGKPNLIESYIKGLMKYEGEKFRSFSESLQTGQPQVAEYLDREKISDLSSKLSSGNLRDPDQEAERVLLWRSFALQRWLEMQNHFVSEKTHSA